MHNHRRVLSSIDTGAAASSDDSHEEEIEDYEEGSEGDLDDGHQMIGVSIGQTQTHLRAAETPAVEKEEALAGQDPFDAALRYYNTNHRGEPSPFHDQRYQAQDTLRHGKDIDSANGQLRKSYISGLDGSPKPDSNDARRQSKVTTGRPFASTNSQSKKLVNFNLPSLPTFHGSKRFSLPSIDGALNWVRGPGHDNSKAILPSNPSEGKRPSSMSGGVSHQGNPDRRSSLDNVEALSPSRNRVAPPSAPRLLRRSTSDNSLSLLRSASRASSLGDDTRFEDISQQVNSRMKAIKDSWADANLKMPTFRPNWLDTSKTSGSTSVPRNQQRGIGGFTSFSGTTKPALSSVSEQSIPAFGGMSKASAQEHPEFTRALTRLTGDVVILGGYRGSVLRSAEPPNRQLWIPVKVGLNIRKVNMEVGLDHEDEERMEETIIPSGMLKHIGPVDISRRLFKRLHASRNATEGRLRVWDYGYDWRLSPHLLSRHLEAYLDKLPCNRRGIAPERRGATVIAHSFGGLLTRHIINRRPELISGVVYAGVPQTCVNILGPLRNGDAVLLSSKVLTAQVNFTIRSSFALLPLDGKCFLDEKTKEPYHVDFFDPKTWDEYRLSPCIARPLPPRRTEAAPQGVVSHVVGSMASVLPSVSVRKNSVSKMLFRNSSPARSSSTQVDSGPPEKKLRSSSNGEHHDPQMPEEPMSTQMGNMQNPQQFGASEEKSIPTAVTIPRDRAYEYLTRTLAEVKAFKQELAYKPDMEQRYPPAAVIYGKSVPTVAGAKVRGRDGIKRADAYERLQFASGDGVVLARSAQIPEGYHSAPGGVVSSDRGHIGLLGDLEAVGTCLNAILIEQRKRRTPGYSHDS